jgi:Effector Associated Constant Component 1
MVRHTMTGDASPPAELTITPGSETATDELYSLRAWLLEEEDLRGRIGLVESPPASGKLGALPEALTMALGPGGAATAASALIAWLRYRTSDVRLKLTRPDGSTLEVESRRVHGISTADVSAHVDQLCRMLAAPATPRGESVGDAPPSPHPTQ